MYIVRQCHDSGSPVVSNGSSYNGERKFVCHCFRVYKEYIHKKQGPFRKDYIVNSDKKGRRPNGRSGPRRCTTRRPVDKNSICQFKFLIAWDATGYYVNQTAGNSRYTSHPKIDPSKVSIPTRLIPDEEKENLVALAQSCVGSGVGRNFFHSKLGHYISCAKVAYFQ